MAESGLAARRGLIKSAGCNKVCRSGEQGAGKRLLVSCRGCCFQMKTKVMAGGGSKGEEKRVWERRDPAQRGDSHSKKAHRKREEEEG